MPVEISGFSIFVIAVLMLAVVIVLMEIGRAHV